jgi:hypothetical protein
VDEVFRVTSYESPAQMISPAMTEIELALAAGCTNHGSLKEHLDSGERGRLIKPQMLANQRRNHPAKFSVRLWHG